jgi:hypothetical protein
VTLVERIDGAQIERGILADRGVRAAAGFNAHHPVGGQRLHAHKRLGVLAGVDVIGDDGDGPAIAHGLAELVGQCGLAGADRSANARCARGHLVKS